MSTIKRTHHAVYDLKYHIVWVPKYRKSIFSKELSTSAKSIFRAIAEQYDFEIDIMEIMEDHVHIFVSAPPRYAPAEIVQIFKSISAREIFKKYPSLRTVLWKRELWNDGYFVRSVGDKVTSDVIRRYIKYQHTEDQLRFNF
jgi:putative transposase